MAATTQVLAGKGLIDGITGAFTFTDLTGGANFESIDLQDDFTVDRIATQNGGTTETLIARGHNRKFTGKFVPTGTARTDARAIAAALMAFTPLKVITTTLFDVAALNGTWNYMGGARIALTREGYAIVDIQLEAQEVAATAGTFAGLAIAT